MITPDSKDYITTTNPEDAEYRSIRALMLNRGRGANQLPSKVVHFIPENRAESVLALDERIQKVKQYTPLIVFGAVVLAFLLGLSM